MTLADHDIVFCKDCKYADDYYHCHHVNFWNKEDDFCSRGERRKRMTVQTASLKRIEDELKEQFPNVTVFSQESPLSPNCVEIRARAGKANAVVTLDFYTNGCSEDYIANVLAWKLKEVT